MIPSGWIKPGSGTIVVAPPAVFNTYAHWLWRVAIEACLGDMGTFYGLGLSARIGFAFLASDKCDESSRRRVETRPVHPVSAWKCYDACDAGWLKASRS